MCAKRATPGGGGTGLGGVRTVCPLLMMACLEPFLRSRFRYFRFWIQCQDGRRPSLLCPRWRCQAGGVGVLPISTCSIRASAAKTRDKGGLQREAVNDGARESKGGRELRKSLERHRSLGYLYFAAHLALGRVRDSFGAANSSPTLAAAAGR